MILSRGTSINKIVVWAKILLFFTLSQSELALGGETSHTTWIFEEGSTLLWSMDTPTRRSIPHRRDNLNTTAPVSAESTAALTKLEMYLIIGAAAGVFLLTIAVVRVLVVTERKRARLREERRMQTTREEASRRQELAEQSTSVALSRSLSPSGLVASAKDSARVTRDPFHGEMEEGFLLQDRDISDRSLSNTQSLPVPFIAPHLRNDFPSLSPKPFRETQRLFAQDPQSSPTQPFSPTMLYESNYPVEMPNNFSSRSGAFEPSSNIQVRTPGAGEG